jgi:glycerophosphoryl diester phosphodiesterase
MPVEPVGRAVLLLFRRSWRRLLVLHIAMSLVSVLILAPLLATLLGWLVLMSGDTALTDQDILYFVLSPRGALVFVLIASLQLTLLVLEQAAIIVVASRADNGSAGGLRSLISCLSGRLAGVFGLAVRLVLHLTLLAAPFLLVLLLIYRGFLGAHDINYYLAYRPPEFWQASALVAVTLLALLLVGLRLISAFLLALPPVLLDGEVPGSEWVARARKVLRRQPLPLLVFLAGWLLGTIVLLSVAGMLADLGSGAAIAMAGNSLRMLSYLLAGVLLTWAVAHFLATWLSASVLGLGLLSIARSVWPDLDRKSLSTERDAERDAIRWRMSAGVFAVLCGLLVAVSSWILVQVSERGDTGHRPAVIAHRGASAEAPENSLAAIDLAIEQGADWVEIDVQQTADRQVVVVHDSDLMKVAGVPLRVRDATLTQLQAIDIGVLKDAAYTGQRIPTLQQVLEQVRGRGKLIIELKYYGGERDFEAQVARIVERVDMADQVQIMSLSLAGVRAMQAHRPGWSVGLLSSVGIGDLTRLDVDFLAVNARLAARSFVRRTQRTGQSVYAWTINDPALMSTMAGRGLDGIITDYPATAARVLTEREQLDLHELLIINAASLMGSRKDVAQ